MTPPLATPLLMTLVERPSNRSRIVVVTCSTAITAAAGVVELVMLLTHIDHLFLVEDFHLLSKRFRPIHLSI